MESLVEVLRFYLVYKIIMWFLVGLSATIVPDWIIIIVILGSQEDPEHYLPP